MSKEALDLLIKAAQEQEAIANGYVPALDEILLFSLERKYLGIDRFSDLFLEQSEQLKSEDLPDRLRQNIRLLKVQEICYERGAQFHLSSVESVLSSMRECGHSLVFLVCGEPDRATVYFGLSQFSSEPAINIDEAIGVYESAWRANFPGGVLQGVADSQIREISASIGLAKHCGFLTGLPSLKREEARQDFVQGLERRLLLVLTSNGFLKRSSSRHAFYLWPIGKKFSNRQSARSGRCFEFRILVNFWWGSTPQIDLTTFSVLWTCSDPGACGSRSVPTFTISLSWMKFITALRPATAQYSTDSVRKSYWD